MKLLAGLAAVTVIAAGAGAQTAQQPPAAAARGAKASAAPPQAAAATPEELAIAGRVHVGHMPCEMGQAVTLKADDRAPGHFDLHIKHHKFRMFPVATTTGAIRLEDHKAGVVWLQLANKSMLMNHKLGQRLADACMSPAQIEVAAAMEKNPVRSVLDSPDAPAPAVATK
ncbi:MAG: hypothetical protein ACKOWD_04120 [Rhodoferax sp.]